MQKHRLIALSAGRLLDESRAAAFDLNSAASLLLNMFDIGAALTYDLRPQVESGNRLEIDGNTLLGPFSLVKHCQRKYEIRG